MLECLKKFEKLILVMLLGMMMLVVLLSTVELGYIIVKDILSPPVILLEIDELLEIFGFFLLVLIGIELLETLKAYFIERVVHAEIVLMVAIIAVGRKVITLDVKDLAPMTLLGIGVIILTLAVAYYIVRWDTRLHPTSSSGAGPASGVG
jgi:uncharacterized membrane protein (DUF373 family)